MEIRRAKKIWGTREKFFFSYKRTAFFSGTPNFFGPSYFKEALLYWLFDEQMFSKLKNEIIGLNCLMK